MTLYIEEAIINIGVRGKGKMGETDMKEKESQRCASGYSLKLSIPKVVAAGQFHHLGSSLLAPLWLGALVPCTAPRSLALFLYRAEPGPPSALQRAQCDRSTARLLETLLTS